MKHLFYFILLAVGFSAVHSCKDMVDDEGSPLIDLNPNTGLNGNRGLFREITDTGVIAEYHYNGLQLSNVYNGPKSITSLMWSGDKISQINFKGHLDSDGDATLDDDSIVYTRLLTYGNQGRLSLITETRSVFTRTPATTTLPAGPYLLSDRIKAEYNLKYNATSGKLDSINMKSGKEVAGVTFEFNKYAKTAYSYLGDNVSFVDRKIGTILAGVNITPNEHFTNEFLSYDNYISPYTLLPFAYKISTLIDTNYNDGRSMILSPNNPKRKILTDLSAPLPVTSISTSSFDYDPQTYALKGYGINYIYKIF